MTIHLTEDYTVDAGEVAEFQNASPAFQFDEPGSSQSVTLYNYGSITVANDNGGDAIAARAGYDGAIFENHGLVEVSAKGMSASAVGFVSDSWEARFLNTGNLVVTSEGEAYGAMIPYDVGTPNVINEGQISVSGIVSAYGVAFEHGGQLSNRGKIDVFSRDGQSIGVQTFYTYIKGFEFVNKGKIVVSDRTTEFTSIGMEFAGDENHGSRIINRGVIKAEMALLEIQTTTGDLGTTMVENYGKIFGDIDLNAGDDIINNPGMIFGDVFLQSGADRYDGSAGVLDGTLLAGDGSDTLIGGLGDDILYGEGGADLLDGGDGHDILNTGRDADTAVGGKGDDAITGDFGHQNLSGGAGQDTLKSGFGSDTLNGGVGRDRVDCGADAERDVLVFSRAVESAGKGYDIITNFDFSEDVFDFKSIPASAGQVIQGGFLDKASFVQDLAAALDDGELSAGEALCFAPDEGSLAGAVFLIVDANGVAGWQTAQDYVIQLLINPGQVSGAFGIEDFI